MANRDGVRADAVAGHAAHAHAIRYHRGFLDADEAAALFDVLVEQVRWQHERIRLYGRFVAVPRLLSWYGDHGVCYRYAGNDHTCDGWLSPLQGLSRRLACEHGLASNLVLLNRYRDGSDYMGWHRDDERGHGDRVASLSLGAVRRFLVRLPGESRSRPFDLEPGSLLLLDGRLAHSLPRTRRCVGERINLTFRTIRQRS